MKKRWSFKKTLNATKRGAGMTLVSAIVLMPLVLATIQYSHLFKSSPTAAGQAAPERKVADVQPLAIRPADAGNQPLKPFQQPIISVTFDDGWESIYTDGLPLLQQYGIPTTQYVMSGVFANTRYMTAEQLTSLDSSGHEIACHTIDHSNLTTLAPTAVDNQLRACQQAMQKQFGKPIKHFASPYGASNPATIAAIKRVYGSHRNTNGDIVKTAVNDADVNTRANFDRYNIIAVTIRRDTTLAQIQQAIDYTVQNNAWLVLNYHNVEDDDSEYGVNYQSLEAQLRAISTAKARVVTVGQFLDAYQIQTGRQ